jgi:hypothetical protein
MVILTDPILTMRPPPDGIELPPLHEPESMEVSPSDAPAAGARMPISASKVDRLS